MRISNNRQLRFTVSPANYKLLEKWASFHGKTPGEFGGQIIANRLEVNRQEILDLDKLAKELAEEPDRGDDTEIDQ